MKATPEVMHQLKTWPEPFQAQLDGRKTFEVRLNDRQYQVGDTLWLEEWDPGTRLYTGRRLYVRVTYVLDLSPWCRGYVAMQTEPLPGLEVA